MINFLLVINTLLLSALLVQRGVKHRDTRAIKSTVERMEKTMATKEDVTRLEDALKGVQDSAEAIANDTAALKDELKKANENAAVNLDGAIATAEGIEARLRGIAGSAVGSDPEDAPPPPVEGAGDSE